MALLWLTAAPTLPDHRVPLRAAPPAEPVPEPAEPPAPKKPKASLCSRRFR